MTQTTIPLDDESVMRLQELARQRGEIVEQAAQPPLLSTLPSAAPIAGHLAPDDPDGSKAIRAMAGTVHYPGVTGKVTTTHEEIDRILAEEAMNPHEDN